MFPLLILSKRLHSIFILRLFNDCFAVLALYAAIYCYQTKNWHLGSFFYTTGFNIKMSLLLPLPAMGFMFLQALGSTESITQAMIMLQVSVFAAFHAMKMRLIDLGCLRIPLPQTCAILLRQGL